MFHDKCKHCELKPVACICDDVDSFFNDAWYLMHDWTAQAEYRDAYAVKKGFSVAMAVDGEL